MTNETRKFTNGSNMDVSALGISCFAYNASTSTGSYVSDKLVFKQSIELLYVCSEIISQLQSQNAELVASLTSLVTHAKSYDEIVCQTDDNEDELVTNCFHMALDQAEEMLS